MIDIRFLAVIRCEIAGYDCLLVGVDIFLDTDEHAVVVILVLPEIAVRVAAPIVVVGRVGAVVAIFGAGAEIVIPSVVGRQQIGRIHVLAVLARYYVEQGGHDRGVHVVVRRNCPERVQRGALTVVVAVLVAVTIEPVAIAAGAHVVVVAVLDCIVVALRER